MKATASPLPRVTTPFTQQTDSDDQSFCRPVFFPTAAGNAVLGSEVLGGGGGGGGVGGGGGGAGGDGERKGEWAGVLRYETVQY